MLSIPNRAFLRLKPLKEATNFLQGLCTNDATKLPTFTAFLNPNGRILLDSFIYPQEEDDSVILDFHQDSSSIVRPLLSKYLLRSPIKVEKCHPAIFYDKEGFKDPRHPDLPKRKLNWAANGLGEFGVWDDKQRFTLGVPEGPMDLIPAKALPLESNLDLMNGVDFTKGCYVGQELTFRTHSRGVTRKRIIPIKLETNYEIEGKGEDRDPISIFNVKSKRAVGKLLSHSGGVGLALLRLSSVETNDELWAHFAGEKIPLKVIKPWWWTELQQKSPESFS